MGYIILLCGVLAVVSGKPTTNVTPTSSPLPLSSSVAPVSQDVPSSTLRPSTEEAITSGATEESRDITDTIPPFPSVDDVEQPRDRINEDFNADDMRQLPFFQGQIGMSRPFNPYQEGVQPSVEYVSVDKIPEPFLRREEARPSFDEEVRTSTDNAETRSEVPAQTPQPQTEDRSETEMKEDEKEEEIPPRNKDFGMQTPFIFPLLSSRISLLPFGEDRPAFTRFMNSPPVFPGMEERPMVFPEYEDAPQERRVIGMMPMEQREEENFEPEIIRQSDIPEEPAENQESEPEEMPRQEDDQQFDNNQQPPEEEQPSEQPSEPEDDSKTEQDKPEESRTDVNNDNPPEEQEQPTNPEMNPDETQEQPREEEQREMEEMPSLPEFNKEDRIPADAYKRYFYSKWYEDPVPLNPYFYGDNIMSNNVESDMDILRGNYDRGLH